MARINIGDFYASTLSREVRNDGSVWIATDNGTVRVDTVHDTRVLGGGCWFVVSTDDSSDDCIVREDTVNNDSA